MKNILRKGILMLALLGFSAPIMAQMKLGYIQSERIRAEFDEFKEAEAQLQLEYQKIDFEYKTMMADRDSLVEMYEVQKLMALDKGKSVLDKIQAIEKELQFFQEQKVGPQGELMRIQAQMEYEILGKVKKAVDKVAIEGGYDFIFDGSVSLLYFKPKYDLTDDVLHELKNLEPSQ